MSIPWFSCNLRQQQRRESGVGGWFEHDSVAGGQSRAKLPREEHQREVPRNDGTHNTCKRHNANSITQQQCNIAKFLNKTLPWPPKQTQRQMLTCQWLDAALVAGLKFGVRRSLDPHALESLGTLIYSKTVSKVQNVKKLPSKQQQSTKEIKVFKKILNWSVFKIIS